MFYSGGTTGTAKGITHLAHDFVLIPERHGHFWEYTPDDVVFATSKKYFTHGLWPGVLIPLYWGATVVLDRRPPTPDVVLATLRDQRVTKLITVPTVLKNVIEHLTQTKRTGADFPRSTSSSARPRRCRRKCSSASHKLTGVEIFNSIGSSEITYEWIANRQKAFKRGSLGKPVFGYEVRLVDDDGHDVTEPDVPGEAWIRSKTACFYYWRKYDKSRETFIGGWTRTGDHLQFDADGFFWFSGRANDLFKVKGLWVTPIEIEAVLTAHPAVREAAVVPFADRDGLTKPRAYLVLRDGFPQDQTAVRRTVRGGAAARLLQDSGVVQVHRPAAAHDPDEDRPPHLAQHVPGAGRHRRLGKMTEDAMLDRRIFIAAAFAMSVALAPAISHADTYPDRPHPPDRSIPGRRHQRRPGARSGQQGDAHLRTIVIDNRGGGGGMIGAAEAARAQPDGYTLLIGNSTNQVLNPQLMRSPPFDPATAFAAITMLAKRFPMRWQCIRPCRYTTCNSSPTTRGPIPASCPMARPAWAPPLICPPSCS